MTELQNCEELKKPEFSVLIFGQGDQTRSFYRNLRKDNDVELFWTGWSGPNWMRIISFIPGQAGILKIKNLDRLKEIYENVGELSYCGLYYLPKKKATELIGSIKSNHWEFQTQKKIVDILKNTTDFFTLNTVFDYHAGEKDGELYNIDLNYGENLNENLKRILMKVSE